PSEAPGARPRLAARAGPAATDARHEDADGTDRERRERQHPDRGDLAHESGADDDDAEDRRAAPPLLVVRLDEGAGRDGPLLRLRRDRGLEVVELLAGLHLVLADRERLALLRDA